MNVLIIGGTRFLGRHLVNALRTGHHSVTLFNTGAHRENAPDDVEQCHGNREHDLARLGERAWDAVIDTCGFLPEQLEISTRYLQKQAAQYVFVSSISALDLTLDSANEETPLLAMPDGSSRSEMVPETYGPLKGLCESVVTDAFPNRALIVRPGLIAGPYDPTDRFTYWPSRIAQGGTVLAPEDPGYFVQFIDVRDLAEWVVRQVECTTSGTFNLTGPPRAITLGDVLSASMQITKTSPRIRWVSPAALKEQGVGEWIDMPLWVSAESQLPALTNIDTRRACEAGLRIRPLESTLRDTLQWAATRDSGYEWKAGLSKAREAQILRRLGKEAREA